MHCVIPFVLTIYSAILYSYQQAKTGRNY